MYQEDTIYKVVFRNSKQEAEVNFSSLDHGIKDFLDHYGEVSLVGADFHALIGDGDGETRFGRLLTASGYRDNPKGFFSELLRLLEGADGSSGDAGSH